jgi:4'-phosphopantetheinyl transferase
VSSHEATAPLPGDSLWLVDRVKLRSALEAIESAAPHLAENENVRAAALVASDADRGRNWRAGRIALRVILGHICRTHCDDGRRLAARLNRQPFGVTAHGEPMITGSPPFPLVFSQSDAGPHLLIGISTRGRIGVDIEVPRSMVMSGPRQALVIAAAEALAASSVAADNSPPPNILQAWTRIEAFAKARGPSLARVLTELGLIGAPRTTGDRSVSPVSAVVPISGLQTRDLTIYQASLAGSSLPGGLVGAFARPTGQPAPPLYCLTPSLLATMARAAVDPIATA